MKQLNENIFHLYNKWKEGYVRKENSLQIRLENFLSNEHSGVYHISEDGKHVDCDGDIYIFSHDLIDGKLPLPFGKVNGDFCCSGCKGLISLEGAPKEVGKDFSCNNCPKLTSLEGAPQIVHGGFNCRKCENLQSLEGAPKKVVDFDCRKCSKLTSLEGAPEKVNGSFSCGDCSKLTSLEGAPEKVDKTFDCSGCKSLTSLEHLPKYIGDYLYVDIRFEEKIPLHIKEIEILKIRYTV